MSSKPEKDCWAWNLSTNQKGYGRIVRNGKTLLAHRMFYEAMYGKIPTKMTIDHLCRNRACVNPHHMEVVSNRENILRGTSPSAVNAKRTHCVHGHELGGDNLRIFTRNASKRRECRECRRRLGKARYWRNPEQQRKRMRDSYWRNIAEQAGGEEA